MMEIASLSHPNPIKKLQNTPGKCIQSIIKLVLSSGQGRSGCLLRRPYAAQLHRHYAVLRYLGFGDIFFRDTTLSTIFKIRNHPSINPKSEIPNPKSKHSFSSQAYWIKTKIINSL